MINYVYCEKCKYKENCNRLEPDDELYCDFYEEDQERESEANEYEI